MKKQIIIIMIIMWSISLSYVFNVITTLEPPKIYERYRASPDTAGEPDESALDTIPLDKFGSSPNNSFGASPVKTKPFQFVPVVPPTTSASSAPSTSTLSIIKDIVDIIQGIITALTPLVSIFYLGNYKREKT